LEDDVFETAQPSPAADNSGGLNYGLCQLPVEPSSGLSPNENAPPASDSAKVHNPDPECPCGCGRPLCTGSQSRDWAELREEAPDELSGFRRFSGRCCKCGGRFLLLVIAPAMFKLATHEAQP
jgi:hypothetical protein